MLLTARLYDMPADELSDENVRGAFGGGGLTVHLAEAAPDAAIVYPDTCPSDHRL